MRGRSIPPQAPPTWAVMLVLNAIESYLLDTLTQLLCFIHGALTLCKLIFTSFERSLGGFDFRDSRDNTLPRLLQACHLQKHLVQLGGVARCELCFHVILRHADCRRVDWNAQTCQQGAQLLFCLGSSVHAAFRQFLHTSDLEIHVPGAADRKLVHAPIL